MIAIPKLVAFALAIPLLYAANTHPAKGIVLEADVVGRLLKVSCEEIPGYMDAMEMEFTVRDPKSLSALKPGSAVNFTIVSHGKNLFAEDIRQGTTLNFDSEPMAAGQLAALDNLLANPSTAVPMGQKIPDFALTDQTGKTVRLSDCEGKVVALTFGYSRCPNPNYCFRLSNNLAQVEHRFHHHAGSDLVLMTIMIDPDHDQGTTLARYAAAMKADSAYWHFLTGPRPRIKQIAAIFGMNFWSVDGMVTHTLHTAIIDRQGRLAVNLEGNQFTPQELSDLVATVMRRP